MNMQSKETIFGGLHGVKLQDGVEVNSFMTTMSIFGITVGVAALVIVLL